MKEIDYNQIDELCVPFIKLFNSVGLYTIHCCEGHNKSAYDRFYIMFDKSVQDDQIEDLIKGVESLKVRPLKSTFKKWMRMGGNDLLTNWMFEYPPGLCTDLTFKKYIVKQEFKLFERYLNGNKTSYSCT